MTDETTRRPGTLPLVPVRAGGLILWMPMMTRFGIGWRDTALFLPALAVGVYLPGRWLVRALRLPFDRLEEATLALAAGMPISYHYDMNLFRLLTAPRGRR